MIAGRYKDYPYKMYDFSTRHVYVFFGGNDGKSIVEHSFDTLYKGEMERALSIGCDASSLSRDFKRFCD